MRYLTADQLPEGVYTPAEAAIVRYAQKSTRLEPIDDAAFVRADGLSMALAGRGSLPR